MSNDINSRWTPSYINTLEQERAELVKALDEFIECSPCRNNCAPDDMTCLTNRPRALLARIRGDK